MNPFNLPKFGEGGGIVRDYLQPYVNAEEVFNNFRMNRLRNPEIVPNQNRNIPLNQRLNELRERGGRQEAPIRPNLDPLRVHGGLGPGISFIVKPKSTKAVPLGLDISDVVDTESKIHNRKELSRPRGSKSTGKTVKKIVKKTIKKPIKKPTLRDQKKKLIKEINSSSNSKAKKILDCIRQSKTPV